MRPYYDHDGITIYHGDCREVLPCLGAETVDLVLTDPPYPKEFDHVWDAFGVDVPRVMKPESFLVTMLGHYQLPRVMSACSESLNYFWCAATENNKCPILHGVMVKVNWKPVLVYRKGKARPQRIWRDRFNVAAQTATWKRSRKLHKWGQSEAFFAEPLGAFCPPGCLVLDPFLGGGTILRVSKDLGYRAIGIEIEERYCEIAAERLRQGVLAF